MEGALETLGNDMLWEACCNACISVGARGLGLSGAPVTHNNRCERLQLFGIQTGSAARSGGRAVGADAAQGGGFGTAQPEGLQV